MIGRRPAQATLMLLPSNLADFIPDDHILKRVEAILELSWLEAEVADCYDLTNGRTSIPPESALRLMIGSILLGIVHDRAMVREARFNLALRWFAGFALDQPLPDHSTFTYIRQRWGADRFRAFFVRIVQQCVDAGLVSGDVFHADATLVRADVSWASLIKERVEAVLAAHPTPDPSPPPPVPKEKKRSRTDPDASLATSNKAYHLEPSYKVHSVVDDQAGVIVDVAVTTGEAPEGQQLLAQLDRAAQTTGFLPTAVTADGSYAQPTNYARLELLGIDPVIPTQREPRRHTGRVPLRAFRYDPVHQRVRCPAGRVLLPVDGSPGLFRGDPTLCRVCPRRTWCLPPRARAREVTIPSGYEALLRARRRKERGWEKPTRDLYRRHRFRAEGPHAEAKCRHGLRRMVRRGIANVAPQVYLTAIVLNLKRLARARRPHVCVRLRRAVWSFLGLLPGCWHALSLVQRKRAVRPSEIVRRVA